MPATNTGEFIAKQQHVEDFVVNVVAMVLHRLDQKVVQATPYAGTNERVEAAVLKILQPLEKRYGIDANLMATKYAYEKFDEVLRLCEQDVSRYPIQDPALEHIEEVFHASNGFWATVAHRIAHAFSQLDIPIIPRAISRIAHSRTGVDIHPQAQIAGGLFIDHGTGIAIGCTAVLEENVNLYNGVVLGTSKKPRKRTTELGGVQKRHPTIRRNVSLYTNAFVGGDVAIGEGATIGAYTFVCRDVAAGEVVLGKKDPTDEPPVGELQFDVASLDEAFTDLFSELEHEAAKESRNDETREATESSYSAGRELQVPQEGLDFVI